MSKVLYILVIFLVTIGVISANADSGTSPETFAFEGKPSPLDHQELIYRHIASVLKRRSSFKGIPNTPQLYTEIVAQIKARIHTEITSKISTSVSYCMKPYAQIFVLIKCTLFYFFSYFKK